MSPVVLNAYMFCGPVTGAPPISRVTGRGSIDGEFAIEPVGCSGSSIGVERIAQVTTPGLYAVTKADGQKSALKFVLVESWQDRLAWGPCERSVAVAIAAQLEQGIPLDQVARLFPTDGSADVDQLQAELITAERRHEERAAADERIAVAVSMVNSGLSLLNADERLRVLQALQ